MPSSAEAAPEVALHGVTTVFDETPVLHNLALTVAPGEVAVLMGPSGAGKTTLVRISPGWSRRTRARSWSAGPTCGRPTPRGCAPSGAG
jgi:ABC-type multidrug transport system ATPase subunit